MLIPTGRALISSCEKYRGWLTREIGGDKTLLSIGVNPSTATAIEDDNTIEAEMRFTRLWGLGRLVKVNLYAYRARFPKDMWAAEHAGVDIVGRGIIWENAETLSGIALADNDELVLRAMREVAKSGGIVLCAWGNIAKRDRVAEFLGKFFASSVSADVELLCIGTNKDGSPKHTLYQPNSALPVAWDPGKWRHAA